MYFLTTLSNPLTCFFIQPPTQYFYPPAREASKEGANLTERKNQHTSVYGVKEFVRLSVCLSVTKFDPNYLRTGKTGLND